MHALHQRMHALLQYPKPHPVRQKKATTALRSAICAGALARDCRKRCGSGVTDCSSRAAPRSMHRLSWPTVCQLSEPCRPAGACSVVTLCMQPSCLLEQRAAL